MKLLPYLKPKDSLVLGVALWVKANTAASSIQLNEKIVYLCEHLNILKIITFYVWVKQKACKVI